MNDKLPYYLLIAMGIPAGLLLFCLLCEGLTAFIGDMLPRPKDQGERRSRILAGECHRNTIAEPPTIILYDDHYQRDHTPPTFLHYESNVCGNHINIWDSE